MVTARIEDVYREHHPRLWRSLLSYTGDPAIASDAESEAYAQAIRRGDGIDDPAAWIWRSAFRIAAGLLKERGAAPVDGSLADVTGMTDSLAEFLSMLTGLSDQQRQCVVLRYVGGYTPTEIAGLLGTSPPTVRVQLHRAHTALRASLGAHEGGRS